MTTPSPNTARGADYHVAALRLLRAIVMRGLDPLPILRQAGIKTDILIRNDVSVRGQALIRLMSAIQETLGDEFLGLTRHRSKLGSQALLVELGLHCDTLVAALKQMLHADRLLTDDRLITFVDRDNEVELRFERTYPDLDPDNALTDLWLLYWHRQLCWMTGYYIPLKRLDVTIQESPSPERLCYYICGDWNPNQPFAALVFGRKFLTLPIVRTRAEWFQHREAGSHGRPLWPEGDILLRTRIMKLLADALEQHHHCPEFEWVASVMGTSTQTLRRHLREEGTSFQALRDEILRNVATDKLRVQQLTVEAVAEHLGFAEPRSFTRAFKRWTGSSPSAYRATELGKAAFSAGLP